MRHALGVARAIGFGPDRDGLRMGLQRQGQQRGDGHEEPGRGAAPRGTGRAHVPAAPVRLACAGSVRPASTPVSTCSRGCIPNDPPCLKKILTALASSNQANCDLRTVLRFVAPAACRSPDAGCFANTPFRTFADEGVDRGAPLRGEDLDLGPDVGQTWTVSGTVFSRLRVPVDSRRFRLAAPAGATVAAATAQHALYGIFTHRRPQHPDPRHAYGRPDDRPRKTPGRSRRGGPAYQPRVARPRTPLSVPSSIGLSRRCASTPRSRFRRSRSSAPRP